MPVAPPVRRALTFVRHVISNSNGDHLCMALTAKQTLQEARLWWRDPAVAEERCGSCRALKLFSLASQAWAVAVFHLEDAGLVRECDMFLMKDHAVALALRTSAALQRTANVRLAQMMVERHDWNAAAQEELSTDWKSPFGQNDHATITELAAIFDAALAALHDE